MIWSCIWQKDTVLSKMTTSSPQDDPTETGTETRCKEEFLQIILKWDEGGNASHYNVLIEDNYASLLHEVKDAKFAKNKSTLQYRRLKRCDVIEIGGVRKLNAQNDKDEVRYTSFTYRSWWSG